MQITLTNLSALKRKLEITYPAEVIAQKFDEQLQKIAHSVKVPGFRPGRVPLEIIKQRYSTSIREDVINQLIQQGCREAIEQHHFDLAGEVAINVTSKADDPHLSFTVECEVYPEVNLDELANVTVEKSVATLAEPNIDAAIERFRRLRATWQDAEEGHLSTRGDRLVLDFKLYEADQTEPLYSEQKFEVVLGEGKLWDVFEAQLYGLKVADHKEFSVDMPTTHVDKKLAGKHVKFTVAVQQLQTPILPELNDAFAEKFGIKEGGLAKLKEEVKNNLEGRLTTAIATNFREAIIKAAAEAKLFELPEVMINKELKRLEEQWRHNLKMQQINLPDAEFPKDSYLERARLNTLWQILLRKIVLDKKVEVTETDFHNKLHELVAPYTSTHEQQEDMIERLKQDQKRMRELHFMLLEEKAFEYLESLIKVTEKTIDAHELLKDTL